MTPFHGVDTSSNLVGDATSFVPILLRLRFAFYFTSSLAVNRFALYFFFRSALASDLIFYLGLIGTVLVSLAPHFARKTAFFGWLDGLIIALIVCA